MDIVGCITFLSLVTLALGQVGPFAGFQQVPAYKPAVAQGFSMPGASAGSSASSAAQSAPSLGTFGKPAAYQQKAPGASAGSSSFAAAQSTPSFGTFGKPAAYQQKAPGASASSSSFSAAQSTPTFGAFGYQQQAPAALFAPTAPLAGDSLSTFASSFSQAVAQSNVLNGLFNSISGVPITKDLYYNDMVGLMQNLGIANPALLGQSVVGAIDSVASIVTPTSYISSVANSVGRFLNDQGLLTPLNAATLSKQYADALATTVSSWGSALTPRSYVSALARGTIDFLRPFNVVSTASAEALANTFVQQLNTLTSG